MYEQQDAWDASPVAPGGALARRPRFGLSAYHPGPNGGCDRSPDPTHWSPHEWMAGRRRGEMIRRVGVTVAMVLSLSLAAPLAARASGSSAAAHDCIAHSVTATQVGPKLEVDTTLTNACV